MIAFIEGKIDQKEPTHVIINVNGIGYEIKIPLSTYSLLKDKEQFKLLTFLHVKEDAHTLYGFAKAIEKQLFIKLISINGVGPSTAIMILSSLTTDELYYAIVQNDVKVIQNVKGIGAKTAQRIILELKDKVSKASDEAFIEKIPTFSHNTIKNEALIALATLGINKNIAEKSLNKVLEKNQAELSLEELIKLALQEK